MRAFVIFHPSTSVGVLNAHRLTLLARLDFHHSSALRILQMFLDVVSARQRVERVTMPTRPANPTAAVFPTVLFEKG